MNKRTLMADHAPIYYQLAEFIKKQIESKKIKLGCQLPSENELSIKYDVSRKTIRHMLAKLAREGYVKRLKGKGTFVSDNFSTLKVIGIITDDGALTDYHRTMNDILGGIIAIASKHNYEIRLIPVDQLERICKENEFVKDKICGFIFIRYKEKFQKALNLIKKAGVPVILEGKNVAEENSVYIDNYTPMFQAVKYLRSLNHSKIGILSYPEGVSEHYDIRKNTLLSALKKYGIKEQVLFEFEPKGIIQLSKDTESIFKTDNFPSAIIGTSDVLAIGALKAARKCGVSIPEELSIIGFDNIPETSVVEPPLTTFFQNYFHCGKTVAEELFSILENSDNKKHQIKIVPELIIRNSCCPYIAKTKK